MPHWTSLFYLPVDGKNFSASAPAREELTYLSVECFALTYLLSYSSDAENGDGEVGPDGEKKKRQTRGGRGVVKVKQKQEIEKRITLSRASRGKRKYVTVITGLSTYGQSIFTGCRWNLIGS